MAKLENTFFKITGITPMTENKRADAERMMAFHMGKQRGKAFAELGAGETRTLQAFGIGDKRMGAAAQGRVERDRGRDLSDARRRDQAPDADVEAYLKGRADLRAGGRAREHPSRPTPVRNGPPGRAPSRTWR
jgi:hypothetical protein